VEWLIRTFGGYKKGKIRLAVGDPKHLTRYYLSKVSAGRNPFVLVGLNDNPDLYMSFTRWNENENLSGKVIHSIERDGIPLLVIKETRPLDSVIQ
jgi:hypothetical protein